MTLEEAKITIYANCIYACEKAGFDLSTICMVDDALRTVIAIADRKTEPQKCETCRYEVIEDDYDLYDMCEPMVEGECRYEPKTELQTCDTCRNHVEMCLVSECYYEPEDKP